MNLRDILLNQKKELAAVYERKYVQREVKLAEFYTPVIKVITGPRRSGKSYYALHHLKDFGYVNFDDEKLAEIENYNDIIEEVDYVYGKHACLFLDEIQNLPRWELFVNRLQRQGRNIVISGSNANLLSRELATHLTGRHLNTLIFPFSFREYLGYFEKEHTLSEKKAKLNDYLTCGGYPEPLVYNMNYKNYLGTLFDSILFKDIVTRHNIRYPDELEKLARFLVSNFSGSISYNKLKKHVGINSIQTIKKYIGYLKETYLIFELKRFSFKVKRQEQSAKKIYIVDNGIIKAKSFSFSKNTGKLFENLVAVELKKQELRGNIELYYYKNKYEVDFAVKRGNKVEKLIQVCYDLSDRDVKGREIRGLLHASRDTECDDLTVINKDYDGSETAKWYNMSGEVKFVSLLNWLEG